MSKKKAGAAKKGQPEVVDSGRRNLLYLGLGAAAVGGTALVGYERGWLSSSSGSSVAGITSSGGGHGALTTLPPLSITDTSQAVRITDELIEHYARELDNASALIHAIRGMGKGFKRANGSPAVDFLCNTFAAEREVNGKRYVYFQRDAEVHENSFLKTFLEANVSMDQPITAGGNRYTLRDLSESAKSLFRFDPQNMSRYEPKLVGDHLPWTLIAFSILIPPTDPVWTNAWGEKINLNEVIDRGLSDFEKTSALTTEALIRGEDEPEAFRTAIKEYSCFGLHSVYGFLSCLKHGFASNDLSNRLIRLMDNVSYRMKGDAEALEREYRSEGQGAPPIVVEGLLVRAVIKLYGHAQESISYVNLHRLLNFSPGEERRFADSEAQLEKSILRLRALDWGALRRNVNQMLGPGKGDVFISDIIIALGHAARGLKLRGANNPDTAA
jgi:hypothetical protein